MDDLIQIVEKKEEVGTPVFIVYELPDGDYHFQTSLDGPLELLSLLKCIEQDLLEDALG